MLAGWSSGSKYPLLGSVRATAQMVSYEAALGLSVVSVVLLSGSLSTHDIVASQAGEGYLGIVPHWNVVVTGVVPFVVFLIAGTAELNRPPFDLVEAEQELVGGFHTEYSSIRFALFYLAEFMNTVTMSAIIVTLFLGGPAGPALVGPDFIWPTLWFVAKLLIFLFMFMWFRATLPRFRYDQLMDLGWKVLIPLSLGWLLFLAAANIARDEDWNVPLVIAVCFAVLIVAWLGLTAAMRVSASRRDVREYL
jgi:NADH-quinone oxidoreductase subunit H